MGHKHDGVSEVNATVAPEPIGQRTDQMSGEDKAPLAGEPLESAVNAALQAQKVRDARKLVANAEAILAGHPPADALRPEPISRSQIAAAKARIAIATGDRAAARAILVQAIEADPKTTTLRPLMTEVMMAEGRATDVRSILKHLGNPPSRDASTEDAPSLLDTSQ